jgi:hypothetical protein
MWGRLFALHFTFTLHFTFLELHFHFSTLAAGMMMLCLRNSAARDYYYSLVTRLTRMIGNVYAN